jgi:hypothetical protein
MFGEEKSITTLFFPPTYGGLTPFCIIFLSSFLANSFEIKILIKPGPLISAFKNFKTF